MRMLVFGGTRFLSRAVAATALARGYDVTCAARGESGPVPDGARFVPVDRDRGLPDLGEFDASVDTARMSLRWVRDALAVPAAHRTFVSSISVYADTATRGQTVGAPLLDPGGDDYGEVKVASENAVLAAGAAFIVRAGLIVGPGDLSDRFGYWPARFSRGGRVLVPGDAAQVPASWIDVRDLAAWIVDAAERDLTGTFDAVGPAVPLTDLLDGIAAAVAPPGTALVPVPADVLRDAGVAPWAGPRSLPLWLPPELRGLQDHDVSAALAAGLHPRPLSDTAAATLDHERTAGLDRARQAGLTLAEEAELLAAWDAGRRAG